MRLGSGCADYPLGKSLQIAMTLITVAQFSKPLINEQIVSEVSKENNREE